MAKIQIAIQLLDDEVKMPFYAKSGDAGMDIRANEDVVISCGETVIVKTGIKVAVPVGYELQARPRSGNSVKTALVVNNSPGTIDSGFRGEVGIILRNTSLIESKWNWTDLEKGGAGIYKISKGDRIAQIVLNEVPEIEWIPVDDVSIIGEDRQSGFGQTGVK